MSRPLPLHAEVAENVIEFDLMLRRYEPGGYDTFETTEITHFWRSRLHPEVTVLSTTVGLVSTALQGTQGYESPGFKRTARELWARGSNILLFRRRDDEGPTAA